MEDLLLGFVADRAGVVEDQSRVGLVLDAHVALMLERPNDLFRVMGVHLAAKRLDVEGLRHFASISSSSSCEKSLQFVRMVIKTQCCPSQRIGGVNS